MADPRAQEDGEGLERQASAQKLTTTGQTWAAGGGRGSQNRRMYAETLERKMLKPNRERVIPKVTEGVA